MDLASLYAYAVLVLGVGAAATALAPRTFSLLFLEAGQDHGRFAGLGKAPTELLIR
jgi:hypothetical protein